MSSANSARIAEIFTQAGLAFNKLGELTMALANNNSSNGGTANKWSDAEVAMLRDAVSRFGRDLHKLTQVLRHKSVAQIRNQLRRKEFKDAGLSDPGDLPGVIPGGKATKMDPLASPSMGSGRRRRGPVSSRKTQLPAEKRRRVMPPNLGIPEEDEEEEDDEEEEEEDEGGRSVASSTGAMAASSSGSRPPPIVTGFVSSRASPGGGSMRADARPTAVGSLVPSRPSLEEEEEDEEEEEEEEEEGLEEDEADTEPGYGASNLPSPSENPTLHHRGDVSDIDDEDEMGIDEMEEVEVKEEDDEEGEDYLIDEEDEIDDDIDEDEEL